MVMIKTIKPWDRVVAGDKLRIPAGKIIDVDLRKDLDDGLAKGVISRDLKAKVLEEDYPKEKKKKAKLYTEDQKNEMSAVAKYTGLQFVVIWDRVKKEINNGGDFDKALFAIRKQHGMCGDEEIIADYAEEIKADAGEIQADFYECTKEFGLGIGAVIARDRLAREFGSTLHHVCGLARDMIDTGGLTTVQVLKKVRVELEDGNIGEPVEPEELDVVELDGKEYILSKTQVKFLDDDKKFPNAIGTVVNVTNSGMLYVKIDGDEAQYRKNITADRVKIIADEGEKQ